MIILIILLSPIVLALPIAWFVSEFQSDKRKVRCTLGVLAILSSFGVAWLTVQVNRFNYNAWYGAASKNLIETVISQIENGKSVILLEELKELNKKFSPTYEYRAHYDELVKQSVANIENKAKSRARKSKQP